MTDPSSLDTANLGLSRFQLDQSLNAGKSIELVIPKSGVYDALRVKGRVLELPGPVFLEAGSTLVVRLNGTTNVLELSTIRPPDRSAPTIESLLQGLLFDSLESAPLGEGEVRKQVTSLFQSLGSAQDRAASAQVLFRDRDSVRGFFSEMLKLLERHYVSEVTLPASQHTEQGFVSLGALWLQELSPKLQELIGRDGGASLEKLLESDETKDVSSPFTTSASLESLKLAIYEVAKESPVFSGRLEFPNTIADFIEILKTYDEKEPLELTIGSLLTRVRSIIEEGQVLQDLAHEDQKCIDILIGIRCVLDGLLEAAPLVKSSSHKTATLTQERTLQPSQSGNSRGKSEEEYLSMLKALLVSQIELIDRLPQTVKFDNRNLFIFPYLLQGNYGSVVTGLFDAAEEEEAGSQRGAEPKADLRFELKLPFLGSIKGEIFLSKQLVQLDFHDPDSYKYSRGQLGSLTRKLGASWSVRVSYVPIRSQRREKI